MQVALAAFVFAFVGCGKSPAADPASASPPALTSAAPTPIPVPPIAPPGRLGHYASGDGSLGFILDRMGTTPKLRMDGDSRVIDFEPDSKTLDHVDFVNRKDHLFLRFESNGRVTCVRGTDSKVMLRDGGANSLRGGVANTTAPPNSTNLRLGHYSSGDGMTGFALDRTGANVRMRFDDSASIVELDSELSLPGRGVVLRFGSRGEVDYFRGNESIAMRRDCDVEPLR